jgi:hypothetical protein
MNKFMNALKEDSLFTTTENGAITRTSTMNGLLDLFSLGASYRTRSEIDCINLFKKAFEENETYAMKCLFYIADIRGGQGERRFFRVITKWLANEHTEIMSRNLKYIPEYRRWDDLYVFVGTPLEGEAFDLMYRQLSLDVQCKTPSLLAKWLKSENTSSKDSRNLANITRRHFKMTHKEYRKTLSILRERIRLLERLMSAQRWDEIEFDKIPSRAGIIYRNAFARHDIERMKSERIVQSYEDFAKDKTTKVNAKALYPYEVVAKAYNLTRGMGYYNRYSNIPLDNTERLMINKYWDNLEDYFKNASLNALCVVDTSGSMWGTNESAPINVAISLGLYCAEKAKGPFAGHYISFSSRPQLIKTDGVDFCDKVERIYRTNLCENTDIEATFDMLLNTAIQNRCTQDDLPESIVIISDMEFDAARGHRWYWGNSGSHVAEKETLMEGIKRKWENAGYRMPNLIFWNVNSRNRDNIPMRQENNITFVSGMSPVLFEQIMQNKTALDLVMDKLNSERYACIK